jgi:hypothetical protein
MCVPCVMCDKRTNEHTHVHSRDDQQPDDIRPPPSQPPALRTHRMYGSPYTNSTRVLVHEKPATRGTWAPHGVDGWYIGPSMLHYRCYRIWIPETLSVRVADTLAWFPAQVKMPALSSTDAATAAARDLIHALQHPTGPSPLAPLHDGDTAALKLLADIIATATRAKPSESSNSGPKSAHSDVASA